MNTLFQSSNRGGVFHSHEVITGIQNIIYYIKFLQVRIQTMHDRLKTKSCPVTICPQTLKSNATTKDLLKPYHPTYTVLGDLNPLSFNSYNNHNKNVGCQNH